MEAESTTLEPDIPVLAPVLLLLSCVALVKLLNLSVLQLSHLFHENIIGPTALEGQKDKRVCIQCA